MRFGVVCGTAVIAAVMTAFASAAGITLRSGPTIPDCGAQALSPSSLTLTCADANYGLTTMKWQHWGAATALGSGMATANDCTPNCAAGTFHDYAVHVTASAIRTCLSGRKQYTRLVLSYPGARPKGIGATDTWPFACDAPGPGSTITAKASAKSQLTLTGTGWQEGSGCSRTVSVGFRDKAKPFASPRVGAGDGFRLTLVDIRAGSVIVARQTCTKPDLGSRLYESAIVVK
jgi:hypothetical protein